MEPDGPCTAGYYCEGGDDSSTPTTVCPQGLYQQTWTVFHSIIEIICVEFQTCRKVEKLLVRVDIYGVLYDQGSGGCFTVLLADVNTGDFGKARKTTLAGYQIIIP